MDITNNQKELISKVLLDYKRNSKIRNMQNKYIKYKKIDGYFYKFLFSNLKPSINYNFYMKDMKDNYKLLFCKKSSDNGLIKSFKTTIPPSCIGESYDFILIPETESEYYFCSIYPHPIRNIINDKSVTLDMIFPKGLLWSCYGENFVPNSKINIISFSGDEMITKRHMVDENGKFTFFVTPFSSNNTNKSKISIITENKDCTFELYYNYGKQCKPILQNIEKTAFAVLDKT